MTFQKGLELNKFIRLNTWNDPEPVQLGPPQNLGPGPIQVLFRF